MTEQERQERLRRKEELAKYLLRQYKVTKQDKYKTMYNQLKKLIDRDRQRG